MFIVSHLSFVLPTIGGVVFQVHDFAFFGNLVNLEVGVPLADDARPRMVLDSHKVLDANAGLKRTSDLRVAALGHGSMSCHDEVGWFHALQ
jgi:hypothetical protein